MSAALWVMSYHTRRSVGLQTRLGRSELVPHHGRIEFDNEPQRDWELEQATGELGREVDVEYAAVRKAYEGSGRDLADDAHPELRDEMSEHLRRAAELDLDFAAAADVVKRRWLAKPAVHRSVSLAAITAGAAAWPVLLFLYQLVAHSRRQARAASGLCFHCGYDLRASSDRCPECGKAVLRTSRSGG